MGPTGRNSNPKLQTNLYPPPTSPHPKSPKTKNNIPFNASTQARTNRIFSSQEKESVLIEKRKERKITLNHTTQMTRGDLRFYRLLYLHDDGREQLLRDGGVAGAGGLGSLQGRRRHGVHLDSRRFEHVDRQGKQDEKVYRWWQTRKNLKTGNVLLSHGQAKKPSTPAPNFSKDPILDLLVNRARVLTVWQEKLRGLEFFFLDKTGQKE
jgi:hypothetical protein